MATRFRTATTRRLENRRRQRAGRWAILSECASDVVFGGPHFADGHPDGITAADWPDG